MNANHFCTLCQRETEHSVTLDKNNELVVTCHCGHFAKYPAVAPEKLKELFAAHKVQNAGQVFPKWEEVRKAQEAKKAYVEALIRSGIVNE